RGIHRNRVGSDRALRRAGCRRACRHFPRKPGSRGGRSDQRIEACCRVVRGCRACHPEAVRRALSMKQPLLICAAALLAILSDAAVPDTSQRLEQARNLGKAFYENPTTAAEAVAEFKKALDLSPNSDREKLNYALALLLAG